jgi:hypothetical protein
MHHLFLAWLGGVITVYSFLFMIGKVIFQEWEESSLFLVSMTLGIILFYRSASKGKLLN